MQIDRRNPCLSDFVRFICLCDSEVTMALKINNLNEPANIAAGLPICGVSEDYTIERVAISLDGNDRKNSFYCGHMIYLGLRYLVHVPEGQCPGELLAPHSWNLFPGCVFDQYMNVMDDETASLRQKQLSKTNRADYFDLRYFRAGSMIIVHASGDPGHRAHIDAIFAYQHLIDHRRQAARMGRVLPPITEWLESHISEHGMKYNFSNMPELAEGHFPGDIWGNARDMRLFWNEFKAYFDLDVESP